MLFNNSCFSGNLLCFPTGNYLSEHHPLTPSLNRWHHLSTNIQDVDGWCCEDVSSVPTQTQDWGGDESSPGPGLSSTSGLIQVWPPLMCNEVTLKVLKYQGQFQGNESPNKCHSSIICFTKVTSVKCSLSYAALLMD